MAWRDTLRSQLAYEMGDMPFGENGEPLNIRLVSTVELPYCTIENVLFESLPGWDVNASVFLPNKEKFPPPWPAIVVPVGHSSKTRNNYQIPAQAFAAMGFVAVIFDPPGMAGEKQPGNDHFTDGARCYLTGHSSNRYFIMDAIRCIDYLETRSDINMSNGVAMTGVSGGGTTTLHAVLLDDRITTAGPSCCVSPSEFHPVLDGYSACAEPYYFNRFKNGIDNTSLACAVAPVPLFLMYGEKDEIFQVEWSRSIASDIKHFYKKIGIENNFVAFEDTSGHAYTVRMASQFARWVIKWTYPRETALPEVSEADFEMLPPEKLFCYPRQEENMFTINRQLALDLRQERHTEDIPSAVRELTGIEKALPAAKIKYGHPLTTWVHDVTELLLTPEPGIDLPATLITPVDKQKSSGVFLFFDDQGRWDMLAKQKLLAQVVNFLDRDAEHFSLLTVDLRGWGDTKPAYLPFDISSWAHPDRFFTYLTAALGDALFAQQIRDGVSALEALKQLPAVDADKIVVGGRGMGALVALHVAALVPDVKAVIALENPAAFELFATSEKYTWPMTCFLPHVLKYYDVPELVGALNMPVIMVDPKDAEEQKMSESDVEELYAEVLA
ncbi:alpha/beta hydrolase, partial [bacterium]|nr:alpha/beta hydrolase [bacterium]